jgi:hypothetical protein
MNRTTRDRSSACCRCSGSAWVAAWKQNQDLQNEILAFFYCFREREGGRRGFSEGLSASSCLRSWKAIVPRAVKEISCLSNSLARVIAFWAGDGSWFCMANSNFPGGIPFRLRQTQFFMSHRVSRNTSFGHLSSRKPRAEPTSQKG